MTKRKIGKEKEKRVRRRASTIGLRKDKKITVIPFNYRMLLNFKVHL